MSHSIEELKRQMDQAWSKRQDADRAFRERQAEYEKALVAAKIKDFEDQGGILGKTVVRVSDWRGRIDKAAGVFFVMGAFFAYGGARFKLAKIKKDGTPSGAPSGQSPENVFILPEDNQ